MPWWISNFPSDGLIIWRYMKYKYHNWGIAWYSPFFRHTQMFVAGCLKGFLWFGKWFVTLSPKLRSSPRWITAFSLGALRFASKHVEIRQRKVPKISDGYWNRFPVPICWRWCQFYSYCRIVFLGHSLNSFWFFLCSHLHKTFNLWLWDTLERNSKDPPPLRPTGRELCIVELFRVSPGA